MSPSVGANKKNYGFFLLARVRDYQWEQGGVRRDGDVGVVLEIGGTEPTFSTQTGARKMVVLLLFRW